MAVNYCGKGEGNNRINNHLQEFWQYLLANFPRDCAVLNELNHLRQILGRESNAVHLALIILQANSGITILSNTLLPCFCHILHAIIEQVK